MLKGASGPTAIRMSPRLAKALLLFAAVARGSCRRLLAEVAVAWGTIALRTSTFSWAGLEFEIVKSRQCLEDLKFEPFAGIDWQFLMWITRFTWSLWCSRVTISRRVYELRCKLQGWHFSVRDVNPAAMAADLLRISGAGVVWWYSFQGWWSVESRWSVAEVSAFQCSRADASTAANPNW